MSFISRSDVESRRPSRTHLDPDEPWAVLREREPASKESCVDVLSAFLVGAECSFRCTMCDLWKYTLDHPTRPGSLVTQLKKVLAKHAAESWIKLYNASNFFDPRCVPVIDYEQIASLCDPFERVIVENHPRMINRGIVEFEQRLRGRLEIAMGLETVAPQSRILLNKEFELSEFEHACEELRSWDIELRAFVLLQPPGTHREDSKDWVLKSLSFASDCGVRHCSIIPVRGGNGIMEWLEQQGQFQPPSLGQLEDCLDDAVDSFRDMVVTADVWDADRFSGHCAECFRARIDRIKSVNETQIWIPRTEHACRCNASF